MVDAFRVGGVLIWKVCSLSSEQESNPDEYLNKLVFIDSFLAHTGQTLRVGEWMGWMYACMSLWTHFGERST